jgi:hypothetical protein
MIPLLMMTSRVTEVDGTTTQTIQGYNATTLNTDANLVKIMNPLEEKSVLFSVAIRRLKGKSVQKTNDETRDDRITGLDYLLLSSTHSPNDEIKNAAFYLIEIFGQYGLKMKDQSYTSESSLIKSLLTDYAKPKALKAIALVPSCAEFIAALQVAEDNFEANRLSFETAQGEEGTLENATEMKK